MALSEAQRRVLETACTRQIMLDNWTGSVWRPMPMGAISRVPKQTFRALTERGFLDVSGATAGTTFYIATDSGRAALGEKDSE